MAEWGFYGRQDELEKLRRFIERSGFAARRVTGGRGIGKTALLWEVRRQSENNPPMLIFELGDPKAESQAATNQRLFDETPSALKEMASLEAPVPADAEIPGRPQRYFSATIRKLLAQGAVVCLDEFHMAMGTPLEGGVKRLIDKSRKLNDNLPGKLILMGSHQQRMQEMFACTELLHRRAPSIVRLKQWRLPTVFGMAEKQGFLQYPGRMLTLWTAFGGVPGNWERFVGEEADNLARMGAWDNDDAWREAFLGWYRQLLGDPEERYDNRAFVELGIRARQALLHLALRAPKAQKFKDFPKELRQPPKTEPGQRPEMGLGDALEMLHGHLGLVEYSAEFMATSEPKWRIADNNTLFQLSVCPELFAQLARKKIGDNRVDAEEPEALAPAHLQTLEGHALERMAAAWLATQPGVDMCRHAVSREGKPDIDVLAIRGQRSDPLAVVMAGCKRNAEKHDTAVLKRQFDEFLRATPHGWGRRLLEKSDEKLEKLLFSPDFIPPQYREARKAGFRALGIHDMVKRGPGHTPLHEAAEADDTDAIARLIGAGADIEARNRFGETPLHDAARHGALKAARTLVELGADPPARDQQGNTVLHLAAADPEMADLLVTQGADPNASNSADETPLHRAARFGTKQAITTLADLGGVLEVRDDDGRTPLHWAAGEGKPAVITTLIELGADPETRDQEGATALDLARRRGDTIVIETLEAAIAPPPAAAPAEPPAEPDGASTPSM